MRERFASGLNDKTAEKSIKVLNDNLSQVIDLSLIVKQAHWTLRGAGFIGVHELLDSAAGNLRGILDTMAERVVILGGTPDGTSQNVAKATTLPPYPADLIALRDHVRELTERYKIVAASVREGIGKTEDDEDTSDLLTEASRIIDKDAWFIGSNAEHN